MGVGAEKVDIHTKPANLPWVYLQVLCVCSGGGWHGDRGDDKAWERDSRVMDGKTVKCQPLILTQDESKRGCRCNSAGGVLGVYSGGGGRRIRSTKSPSATKWLEASLGYRRPSLKENQLSNQTNKK